LPRRQLKLRGEAWGEKPSCTLPLRSSTACARATPGTLRRTGKKNCYSWQPERLENRNLLAGRLGRSAGASPLPVGPVRLQWANPIMTETPRVAIRARRVGLEGAAQSSRGLKRCFPRSKRHAG